MKQPPIDDLAQVSVNAFQLLTIGFLLGTSLYTFEWIIYRTVQDLFILIDTVPITTLWLANVCTTTVHFIIVLSMYFSIRKKLEAGILNWKKLLDHSKYLFSIAVLLNIFISVYWDLLLPPSFFNSLQAFEFVAGGSSIYFVLPVIFSTISVILVLILLKRLSDKVEKSTGLN